MLDIIIYILVEVILGTASHCISMKAFWIAVIIFSTLIGMVFILYSDQWNGWSLVFITLLVAPFLGVFAVAFTSGLRPK